MDYKKRLMKDIKVFPKEKKKKKQQQYWREQYRNLPEDEKQKLVEGKKMTKRGNSTYYN